MTVLTKIVTNCETGVTEIIELTAEEIAQLEIDAQAYATFKAEQEAEDKARADAKASALAKLAALGLTPEEISAL
jgi:phage FluMu protein gp41